MRIIMDPPLHGKSGPDHRVTRHPLVEQGAADRQGTGSWNMAVDEALLERATARREPTLRFYGWSEPTLSLGYFQPYASRHAHAASRHCPIVRRPSGGGAILHDRELTYCLVATDRAGMLPRGEELYSCLHATLARAVSEQLAEQGVGFVSETSPRVESEPWLCFQRRTRVDLVRAAVKIAGSAQRRHRRAVLQHGSVLLAPSRFAPELPGLDPSFADATLASLADIAGGLAWRWAVLLAELFGVSTEHGQLDADEVALANRLERDKFSSPEWLFRR